MRATPEPCNADADPLEESRLGVVEGDFIVTVVDVDVVGSGMLTLPVGAVGRLVVRVVVGLVTS
jgi:hypothetical protein